MIIIMRKSISIAVLLLVLFNVTCSFAIDEDYSKLYTKKYIEFHSNQKVDTTSNNIDLLDLVCVRYVEDQTPIALCGYHNGYMCVTVPLEFANKEIEIFFSNDFKFNDDLKYSSEHLMFEIFEALHIRGIILSDENNNIYPDKYLTRGEVCNLFVKFGGFNRDRNDTIPFTDISEDYLYRADIATLYNFGIIHGVNPVLFEPDRFITREELVVISSNFVKFLMKDYDYDVNGFINNTNWLEKSHFNRNDFYSKNFKDGEKISFWARDAYELMDIYVMYDEDYYAYFSPQLNANRYELAKLFLGLLEINQYLCV